MAIFNCLRCRARTQFKSVAAAESANVRIEAYVCTGCKNLVATQRGSTQAEDAARIIWPPQAADAHADIPADVRHELQDALTAFNTGLWKLSLMGTRAALQASMREQNAQGSDLKAEIADLASHNVIPGALAEWATEVRLAGNLGAHPKPGEVVTEQDAREILALADSIFEYLYVVPAGVARRKSGSAPP